MCDDFADLLPSSFVHVLEYVLCIEIAALNQQFIFAE
jgi:hypothetical protein